MAATPLPAPGRGRGRGFLPWLVVGLLLIELVRSPIPMVPLADTFDRQALDALAGARGALIWLPFAEADSQNALVETARMLQNRALIPMVNGYSGYIPPTYRDFQRLAATEEPAVMAPILNSLGVHTVVLDTQRLSAAAVQEWEALSHPGRAAGGGGQPSIAVRDRGAAGRLRVFEIEGPAAANPDVEVSIPGGRFTAGSRVDVGLDFANRSPVPWVNRRPDGLPSVQVRWTHQDDGRVFMATERLSLPLYVAPSRPAAIGLEVTAPPVDGQYVLEVDAEGSIVHARQDVVVVLDAPPTSRVDRDGLQSVLQLDLPFPGPLTVSPGAPIRLHGSLMNTGRAHWLSHVSGVTPGQVKVGYRWYPRGQERAEVELKEHQGRIDLQRDVLPGGVIFFAGALTAPMQPGAYTLRVAAVAEGVAWFSETDPSGRSVVSLPVIVTGP